MSILSIVIKKYWYLLILVDTNNKLENNERKDLKNI